MADHNLSIATEPNLAILTEQMAIEKCIHGFYRLPKTVGAPVVRSGKLIVERSIVEPLSFYFCLNSELLQLLERCRCVVAGIKENDRSAQLINEVDQRAFEEREWT